MKLDTLTPCAFWGKLHPREAPTDWHPLVDHGLDVASVGRQLLELPTWRARLVACSVPVATHAERDALAVLIGLHDLGKFSPAFQWARTGRRPKSHVDTGLQALEALKTIDGPLTEVLDRLLPESADGWLQATICHHGRPRTASTDKGWPTVPELDVPGEVERLIAVLLTAFPGARAGLEALPPAPPDATDRQRFPATHALCGLSALADWIGSNTQWFPFRPDPTQDRIAFAHRQAALAIEHLGLMASRLPQPPTFAQAFPQHAPRGLQQTVLTLPLPSPGSVTIFEAFTGSGKTEAALHWYARSQQTGLVDGLHFAVPNRPTRRFRLS